MDLTSNSNLRGIFYMVLATFTFTVNDTFLKLATEGLPPFETLFLRGVAAAVFVVPLLFLTRTMKKISGAWHPRVIIRNICELGAVLFFILALANIPIADISAMVQVAPMLLILGVALVYRERVSRVQGLLISMGFVGALLVAQPGSEGFSYYSLFGLGTAVLTAARDIISRGISSDIPGPVVAAGTIVIVIIGSGVANLVTEPFILPSGYQVLLLTGSGLFLMFGHLSIYLAYRTGEVGATAPFFYTFTLWSVLSGVIVFGSIPNPLAAVGMGLVLVSGVVVAIVSRRPRKLRVLA